VEFDRAVIDHVVDIQDPDPDSLRQLHRRPPTHPPHRQTATDFDAARYCALSMAVAKKKRVVSDDHKNAMAQGRTQSRAVSAYLEAMESHRPKRGRKRTPESIDRRVEAIDSALAAAKPVTRLSLLQERMNLLNEKAGMDDGVDLSSYEDEFVAVAHDYGQRKGISYTAWRELGVPPAVLKRAGITRAQ
jgi:hypothetical protein